MLEQELPRDLALKIFVGYFWIAIVLEVVLLLQNKRLRTLRGFLSLYKWWRPDEFAGNAKWVFWLSLLWLVGLPFAFYFLVWRNA